MPHLEFSCKDDKLTTFYQDLFGEQFQEQLAGAHSPAEYGPLALMWKQRMYEEAARQEHYDYTEDDEGNRTPVFTTSNDAKNTRSKKLLIPEIRIVEGDPPDHESEKSDQDVPKPDHEDEKADQDSKKPSESDD